MLNTIPTSPAGAIHGMTSDTQKHLRQHGGSLCDLLDAIGEPGGIDALCDLYGAFETPSPDAATVEAALRDIERLLAKQAPSSLDRLGRAGNFHAAEATRWHGARMSELVARFRDAS